MNEADILAGPAKSVSAKHSASMRWIDWYIHIRKHGINFLLKLKPNSIAIKRC
jgi:hypothetical protein